MSGNTRARTGVVDGVELPFIRPRLALPFAALAAVGAWLVGDWYRLDPGLNREMGGRAVMLVLSPAFALAVGALAARASRWRERAAIVALGVPLCGMLEGMITAAVVTRPSAWETAVARGALEGVLVGLCFLPALGLVMLATWRAERTRHGTLLNEAARRGPARAVVTALFAGALVVAIARGVDVAVVDVGIAAILGLFAVVVWTRDLLVTSRLARVLARAAEAKPRGGDRLGAPDVIDLGVGEGERDDVGAVGHAYREVEVATTTFQGDLGTARRWTRAMAAEGAVAIGLGVVLAAVLATRSGPARAASDRASATTRSHGALQTLAQLDPPGNRALAEAVPVRGNEVRRTEHSYDVVIHPGRTCVFRSTPRDAHDKPLFCVAGAVDYAALLDAPSGDSVLLETFHNAGRRVFFFHEGSGTQEIDDLDVPLRAATINTRGVLVAPAGVGVELRALRSPRRVRVEVPHLHAIGGWIDEARVLLVTVDDGLAFHALDVDAALQH